ncbi:MAG: hypothetical protein AAFP81_19310 [Pseudomonadota bacterium]
MVCQKLDEFSTYCAAYNYTAYLADRDWRYEYLRRIDAFEKQAWQEYASAPSGRIACHDILLLRLKSRQTAAEKWGLRFFPPPDSAAPKARVFWTEEIDPNCVSVTVVPRERGQPHDLFEETIKKCKMLHLTDENRVEHLVHIGPGSSVQVRCHGHTLLTAKPVKTSFSVDALEGLDDHLKMVRRATTVYGEHMADPPEFSRKARLLRNGLIALDGQKAGLSDRQIASIIEGEASVEHGLENGDRSLVKRVKYYRDRARGLCDEIERGVATPDLFICD